MKANRNGLERVLVIGAGLAGIAVSERLLERGIDFQILNSVNRPSSTEAATGMFNPIVFKRINLSWMVDELIPELRSFYDSIGKRLGKGYLEPIEFSKCIPSDDYAHLWNKRASQEEYEKYISAVRNNLGDIHHAGILDCSTMMADYQAYLNTESKVINSDFDSRDLTFQKDGITLKGEFYDHAIFCEGAYAEQNPFWNWLPFKLCKGEMIVIKTELEVCSTVLNNVLNIIPMGNCLYKLSSTYGWEDMTWESTNEAKLELTQAFKEVFDVPFEVVKTLAGIRPTVADRRPFLGRHPNHESISLFNGLGTKGVMLAPYFSKHLIEHLVDGNSLMPDVNIVRHIKRYKNSLLVAD